MSLAQRVTMGCFLVFALGCKAKSTPEVEAGAPVASATAVATTPSDFDRRYAGAIGSDAKATVHLIKNGEVLSGDYAYTSVGKAITLSGKMGSTGEFSLEEKVGATKTGEFQGTLGADGSLSGTWKNAARDKSLPFSFSESSEAQAAAAAAAPGAGASTDTAEGKAIPRADKGAWTRFLVKLARFNGDQELTESMAAQDYEALGDPAKKMQMVQKYKLGYLDSNPALWIADFNNDGAVDYLVSSTNGVGQHNDMIAETFSSKGDKLEKLALPPGKPFEKAITHFASPFVLTGPDGTTFRLLNFTGKDGKTLTVTRYLWKGGQVKALGTSPYIPGREFQPTSAAAASGGTGGLKVSPSAKVIDAKDWKGAPAGSKLELRWTVDQSRAKPAIVVEKLGPKGDMTKVKVPVDLTLTLNGRTRSVSVEANGGAVTACPTLSFYWADANMILDLRRAEGGKAVVTKADINGKTEQLYAFDVSDDVKVSREVVTIAPDGKRTPAKACPTAPLN